jgi:hypothetical protein
VEPQLRLRLGHRPVREPAVAVLEPQSLLARRQRRRLRVEVVARLRVLVPELARVQELAVEVQLLEPEPELGPKLAEVDRGRQCPLARRRRRLWLVVVQLRVLEREPAQDRGLQARGPLGQDLQVQAPAPVAVRAREPVSEQEALVPARLAQVRALPLQRVQRPGLARTWAVEERPVLPAAPRQLSR